MLRVAKRLLQQYRPTGDIGAHAQLWRSNPFQFFSSASPFQFNAHIVWFKKSRSGQSNYEGHGHEVDGNGQGCNEKQQKGRAHDANEGSFRYYEKVVTSV
jgi:hypothetical protein